MANRHVAIMASEAHLEFNCCVAVYNNHAEMITRNAPDCLDHMRVRKTAAIDSLVVLDWRTGIVLDAPDEVPRCRDNEERYEHYGSIVHELWGDGNV